jgi:hypothetical protein
LVLIDDMPDYCGTEFRFRYKPDFRELFELLGFPQYLELSNGGRMLSETAFMWTVRRLASTANVAEILAHNTQSGKMFGGEPTKWGRALTACTDWLLLHHGHRLKDMKPEFVARLPMYAKAVGDLANSCAAAVTPGTPVFGPGSVPLRAMCAISLFIDCNQFRTTRVGSGPTAPGPGAARKCGLTQRAYYNGYAPCAVACPVCARATSFIRHTPAKPLTGEI